MCCCTDGLCRVPLIGRVPPSANLDLYDIEYDELATVQLAGHYTGHWAQEGYQYMTADVGVINNGETRLSVSSSDLSVKDNMGRHFGPDRYLTSTYPDGLEYTTVQPGETYRFHIVVEVPVDEELTLVYEDSVGPLAIWYLSGKEEV